MCDCLCALGPATDTGVALFAKNSDRPPDEAQRLERHEPRRDTGPVRVTHIEIDPHPGETVGVVGSRPWWMWGFEHGVNDAGVAIGNEAIYTTDDPRTVPPALTGMDLVRLGLERATTAAEAVEVMVSLLERYGQGGPCHWPDRRRYWSSFLVADPTDAWVLETSGRTWDAERVTRSRAISNRTTIPAFDAAHRLPSPLYERLVDPRLEASRALLAAEPVRLEAVVAHLRSHEGPDGYSVCMHAEEVTTASMVVRLGEPLQAWVCAGSPCTSVFVPIFPRRPLGTPVAWERFSSLGPERAAALDILEASLMAEARDDDSWNADAWRRVDETLRALAAEG